MTPAASRPAVPSKGGGTAAAILAACALAAPLTRESEGRRLTPYLDPVHILTVCDGHTGADVVRDRNWTPAECEALLQKDLMTAGVRIDRCLAVPVPLPSRAAFTDFALNAGGGAFCGSTMVRLVNAGRLAAACDQFPLWPRAGNLHPPGLVARRARERDLCRKGLT